MKKTLSLFLSIFLCIAFITGCSYKELDDKIQQQINQDSAPETIEAEPIPDDGYTYIEEGETIPDYYKYTFADYDLPDEFNESGYKGLIYKFNGAEVYDSVNDSPISINDCEAIWGDENDIVAYEKNAFILVNMTAVYNNESGDPDNDEIMFRMEFDGMYRWGDGYKEYNANDFEAPYTDPMRIYFSERPKTGDVNLEGKEIDLETEANLCRKSLKSGESIDFQIGILTKKELIEDENVFMFLRYRESPETGNPVYAVDLLGRFKK